MISAVLSIFAILLLFYFLLWKPKLFWKNQHVKQGFPVPFFGDTIHTTFKTESMTDFTIRMYKRYKNDRYFGIYQTTTPILVLRDPDLIKQFLQTDFDHFVDHWNFIPDNIDPIWSKNLFVMKGEPWKKLRSALTPTFTASKMRAMFELMEASAKQYVDFYLEVNQKVIELDLKDSFRRFANDVIGNCAFGVTVDSFKNPENEFFLKGNDATNFAGFWTVIKFVITLITPKMAVFFKLSLFRQSTLNFFQTLVHDAVKLREEKNIIRPDMIHILMEIRKKNEIQMTELDMAAQVLIFFFAGFDTVSIIMSFICYELAVNPDIQEKLRDEIVSIHKSHHGKLTYDVLHEMKYMDMVINESLRKYPPTTTLDRICTKPFTIEPEKYHEKPVNVMPNQVIWIPLVGIHRDEEYFPNPDKFDPERFSERNKNAIRPYTYLPFGTGPRNCIGNRFALMEIKTILFYLLRRFELVVIEKTVIPIKFDKAQFDPAIEGGTWVGYKRRENVL